MGDAHARLQRPHRGGRSLNGDAPSRSRLPIRDAATLVVVDRRESAPRILVGRRAAGHVFMAGRVVFPGGRLDPSDLALARSYALDEPVLQRLRAGVPSRFKPLRAVALALTAIRETFEETGIMIGHADAGFESALPVWRDFAAAGIRPDPSKLVPFARAITPPGQVRRFDTRFFVVDSSAIGREVPFGERPTDEFDRVAWLSLDELSSEDLHRITRRVAEDLVERMEAGTLCEPSVAMPFYRLLRGTFRRDLL